MTAWRRSPRARRAGLLTAALALLAAALLALAGLGAPATAEAQGTPVATNLRLSGWTNCNTITVTFNAALPHSRTVTWIAQKRVNNGEWTTADTARYAGDRRNASIRLTGLSCVARNDIRITLAGLPSDGYVSSASVTAPSLPAQVAGLVFQSVNQTRVSVGWSTPPSYSPITGYTLQHRENQGGTGAWTTVTPDIASNVNSKTIAELTPGTAYEVRVAAKTSVGTGAWSETLFARTSAPEAADTQPPDNLKITELHVEDTSINLSLSWEKVSGAAVYEVEQRVGDTLTTLTTGTAPNTLGTDTHLETTYAKGENDSGELVFRVRARKGSGQSATYTDWSPESFYRFYGAGKVDAPSELAAEVAGNRQLPADVRAVREGVGGAVEQVFAPTGLQVDGKGIVAAVAILPCLAVFLFVAGLGWQAGAPAMGLGAGYVLMTMGLFVGNALLGLDIIWPMLAVLIAVLVGGGAAVRKLGII